MERTDLENKIASFEATLDELKGQLDLDRLKATIESLEKRTYEDGFWDDHQSANKVIADLKHHKNRLSTYEELTDTLENLKIAAELMDMGETVDSVERDVKSFEKTLAAFETTLYLSESYDHLGATIEIHPGAGGTESQDWAEMLYRMMRRYCERRGYTIDMNDYQEASEAGLKSVSFTAEGSYAFGYLKAEAGVHRLVRISPFDASGRRHTSFASVNIIPQIDDTIDVDIQDGDLKIDTYRSSGAGGQSVNTTDSAVRITHLPTGLTVTCQNERSQIKNRAKAMQILRGKLYQLQLEKHKDEINSMKNIGTSIAFGSQIRSYVMHPYTMVKDHRTGVETGSVQKVLDGDLDEFVEAYLRALAKGELTNDNA